MLEMAERGLSHVQIAQEVGLSKNTVSGRLLRAVGYKAAMARRARRLQGLPT